MGVAILGTPPRVQSRSTCKKLEQGAGERGAVKGLNARVLLRFPEENLDHRSKRVDADHIDRTVKVSKDLDILVQVAELGGFVRIGWRQMSGLESVSVLVCPCAFAVSDAATSTTAKRTTWASTLFSLRARDQGQKGLRAGVL